MGVPQNKRIIAGIRCFEVLVMAIIRNPTPAVCPAFARRQAGASPLSNLQRKGFGA